MGRQTVGLGLGGRGAGVPGFMFGGVMGLALDYMVGGQNDNDFTGLIQWGGSAVTAAAGFLAKSPLITAMGVGMFAGTAWTKVISERLGLPRYVITDPGPGGTLRPGTAKLSETFGQFKVPTLTMPPVKFGARAVATDTMHEQAMGSTEDILAQSYYGTGSYGGYENPREQMRMMEIISGEVWAPPVPAPAQPAP